MKSQNKIKASASSVIFDIFLYILMTLVIAVTLYPMLHVLFGSLSEGSKLIAHSGIMLCPQGFSLAGYRSVFKDPMILRGYANTLFVVLVGVGLSIFLTILGAYFLSRKNVMFKKLIMLMILFTMFFSGGMIPFYFTVRDLGLENSIWALIIPSAMNTFNLIIMRTGFESIPDSIEEAAKIDGAGELTIMFRIMVPLAMATIAVVLLYYTVDKWNSWFHAMIFIRDREKYPLQLVLRGVLMTNDVAAMTGGASVSDQESISESVKYAVIIVSTLPVLLLYPCLQKYFVKGMMVGAVKG